MNNLLSNTKFVSIVTIATLVVGIAIWYAIAHKDSDDYTKSK